MLITVPTLTRLTAVACQISHALFRTPTKMLLQKRTTVKKIAGKSSVGEKTAIAKTKSSGQNSWLQKRFSDIQQPGALG